ncbi:hypothetical protein NIES2107_07690 [Nostoc carneum NIES-2107]|nr:hypothetical protein NIES2107_07690 [Nostoc carneum NIES-2107]
MSSISYQQQQILRPKNIHSNDNEKNACLIFSQPILWFLNLKVSSHKRLSIFASLIHLNVIVLGLN